MDLPKWYDCIEDPLKDLVFLLRNNGFNTTCSCGHDMYIEMEHYFDKDVTRLYNLLWENGYRHFRIVTTFEVRETFTWRNRAMRVELLKDKNGVTIGTPLQDVGCNRRLEEAADQNAR